jgi:cohesin loading factor subunit SCC2
MRSNGHPVSHSGQIANGTAQGHLKHRTSGSKPRPLTVDEALPYSPFASVVPFHSGKLPPTHRSNTDTPRSLLIVPSSGIIPLPKIGLRVSSSVFATPAERSTARQGLESLNEKAALPRGTSQELEKTLLDLKHILQPETLTEL